MFCLKMCGLRYCLLGPFYVRYGPNARWYVFGECFESGVRLGPTLTRGRSCQSAVLQLSEHLRKLRILSKELRKDGWMIIPLLLAEDISAAFESLDHRMITTILDRVYSTDGDFNLPALLKSYLTRWSTVIERDSDDKCEINKTFQDRTTPQGSILSPKLWRIRVAQDL